MLASARLSCFTVQMLFLLPNQQCWSTEGSSASTCLGKKFFESRVWRKVMKENYPIRDTWIFCRISERKPWYKSSSVCRETPTTCFGCEWVNVFFGTDPPGQSRTKGRKTAVCVCVATFMRIFTYKLVTYLSTSDVASVQYALFCGLCMVSSLCFGIPGSYRVVQVLLGHMELELVFLAICRQLLLYWSIYACVFVVSWQTSVYWRLLVRTISCVSSRSCPTSSTVSQSVVMTTSLCSAASATSTRNVSGGENDGSSLVETTPIARHLVCV